MTSNEIQNIRIKAQEKAKPALDKAETIKQKLIDFLMNSQKVVISNKETMESHHLIYAFANLPTIDLLGHINLKSTGQHQNIPLEILQDWYNDQFTKFVYMQTKRIDAFDNEQLFCYEFIKQSQNYQIFLNWMKKLFIPIDSNQTYLATDQVNLTQRGYNLFRDIILTKYKSKLAKVAIQMLNNERLQENISKELLKSIIQIFYEFSFQKKIVLQQTYIKSGIYNFLGESTDNFKFYKQNFEEILIQDSGNFYTKKLMNDWMNLNTSEYVNIVILLNI